MINIQSIKIKIISFSKKTIKEKKGKTKKKYYKKIKIRKKDDK